MRASLALPACLVASLALAGSGALAAERREAGKHEHGAGELRVAIDGNDVELEFEGPAANFVGFEHRPRNAEQQGAVDGALAALRNPATLFAWPAAAGCKLTATEVEGPDYGEAEHAGEEHDDHDEDHDHEAGHDHGDEHDHDHDEEHDGETHTEFAVLYAFRCDRPAALDRLKVLAFQRFPATLRLDASVVGPAGQAAATLTPASPDLPLRP
jgi:hypothetical protein